ncbi:unnamed protein product [Paramecium primaurelia]|uniref:Uncharacterized protein n=1 Tax=Paramecium primaurelia TaxID=5886 RepID=A0A8S1K3S7_PARPR|nr:unnamed protein product [Paramecium primaurelia]
MNINQNLQISPFQNSNHYPSRMTIIDQISPIKDIIPQYPNRPSQNYTRNSAREKPQLITTKSQTSIKCETNKIKKKQLFIEEEEQEPTNNIAQAINLLDSLKLKYDNVLESKIETIISILRAQVFDKENCHPDQELIQTITSLQLTNKKLQNELQFKKNQISELETTINKLNTQIKQLQQTNHVLNNDNQKLLQQLKQKEQKQANISILQTQENLKNLEIASQFQQDQQIYYQNTGQIAKQIFEQTIIPYSRKDIEQQQQSIKVNDNKKQKKQINIVIQSNKYLDIKHQNINKLNEKQQISI